MWEALGLPGMLMELVEGGGFGVEEPGRRRKGAEGLRANASGRWTRGGMAARGTAPELGARLSLDDFLIEKELARTQAGTVYKAKHGRSGKMVVLKARRSAEIGRDGSIEHEVR